MTINSRSVRLMTSKIEIDRDLPMGSEVTLRVTGDVVKQELIDNMDGTQDIVFVVKGIIVGNDTV